jgi:hypothetical protein
MMQLDLDLSILNDLEDEEMKSILKRFNMNGHVSFKNDNINKRISRAAPRLRSEEILIMSTDRRTNTNVLSINENILNADLELKARWKDLIKELK